jgi:hypothetical protein
VKGRGEKRRKRKGRWIKRYREQKRRQRQDITRHDKGTYDDNESPFFLSFLSSCNSSSTSCCCLRFKLCAVVLLNTSIISVMSFLLCYVMLCYVMLCGAAYHIISTYTHHK